MNIKILGTLSPYPKDDKNCVGYLINNDKANILLDCGNGSSRLLSFPQDLNNLVIVITHFHPDHYADIFGIINAYNIYKKFNLVKNDLIILIPYDNRDESSLDYYSYMQLRSYQNNNIHIFEVNDGERFLYKDLTINFKRTYHDVSCNAVKIVSKDKTSVGYTSDTGNKPIDELSEFFKNVDLLICESTFLESDNTLSEYHLHALESGLLAKKSNCKQLMLTHFWPEHNPEEYVDESKGVFDNVVASKEGKILKLKALY